MQRPKPISTALPVKSLDAFAFGRAVGIPPQENRRLEKSQRLAGALPEDEAKLTAAIMQTPEAAQFLPVEYGMNS